MPGAQIQIQLYLNSPEIWSQKHGGDRHIRDITADDLKMTQPQPEKSLTLRVQRFTQPVSKRI